MFKEYLDETPVSGALVPWHELPPALPVTPPPLLGVLDEIDYGLLVLNQAAVILYANQLAQQELDDADFVTLQHGKLVTSSAANANADALSAAVSASGRGQRALIKMTSGEAELALSVIPLPHGEQACAPAAAGHCVLIILGKREAFDTNSLRHYGRLHRLTPSEQALLPQIYRGLSIDDMAQEHQISANTIRAHLKSIRLKTGVKSLRVLMARLAALPPIRPAFVHLAAH